MKSQKLKQRDDKSENKITDLANYQKKSIYQICFIGAGGGLPH
jgi:hypothetical protein